MICILKHNPANEIVGWIIASDVHEARHRAQSAGEYDLATALYTGPEFPPRGKHEMDVYRSGNFRYTMLVE